VGAGSVSTPSTRVSSRPRAPARRESSQRFRKAGHLPDSAGSRWSARRCRQSGRIPGLGRLGLDLGRDHPDRRRSAVGSRRRARVSGSWRGSRCGRTQVRMRGVDECGHDAAPDGAIPAAAAFRYQIAAAAACRARRAPRQIELATEIALSAERWYHAAAACGSAAQPQPCSRQRPSRFHRTSMALGSRTAIPMHGQPAVTGHATTIEQHIAEVIFAPVVGTLRRQLILRGGAHQIHGRAPAVLETAATMFTASASPCRAARSNQARRPRRPARRPCLPAAFVPIATARRRLRNPQHCGSTARCCGSVSRSCSSR